MKKEQQTQISVIIPVFNGQGFLSEAITSVQNQTYAPLEIIVVDDGSTDGSAEIVRSFGPTVQYHHQDNQGPAVARNLGVLIARSDMIAFLDADDLWHAEKLSKQVALLDSLGDGYVTCRFHPILEAGLAWPQGFNQAHYESDPVCSLPSGLLLTRSAWERIGPFNPTYRTSEDSEWFFRARKLKIPHAAVPEVLVSKRFHAHNLSQHTRHSNLLRGLRTNLHRANG